MTVESLKEQITEIIQGYAAVEVWNLDECGVLWK